MTEDEKNTLWNLLDDFELASSSLIWTQEHGNPDAERRASQEKSDARDKIFKFCEGLGDLKHKVRITIDEAGSTVASVPPGLGV